MEKLDFQIPLYKVDITLVQVESKEDESAVAELLESINVKDFEYTIDCIKRDVVNGGNTYRNLEHRRIVVVFYPMEDNMSRAEVYSHEKRHIEDRILEFYSVNDIESAGLLSGFLGERFYEFWNKVIKL
jgi:hypothetical protein